jgi:hypothetical protein
MAAVELADARLVHQFHAQMAVSDPGCRKRCFGRAPQRRRAVDLGAQGFRARAERNSGVWLCPRSE